MRLADPIPSHCSACFQQFPGVRHVDFEVAYDGPVIPGSPPVAIDDLIVCEPCLTSAGRVLGLVRDDEVVARAEQAEADRDLANTRVSGLEDFVAKLQEALDAKPQPEVVETTVEVVKPDPATEAALEAAQARVAELEGELSTHVPADPQPSADEKTELQALLRQAGVEPDGRWGIQRLLEELTKLAPADEPAPAETPVEAPPAPAEA